MKRMFQTFLKPMLLYEEKRFVFSNDYLYEIKYDGVRALVYVSPTFFKVVSRNGRDITKYFLELKSLQKLVNKEIIFDGELIAFKNNKPCFYEIMKRVRGNKNIPFLYMAFDLLYEGSSLLDYPLEKRKKKLAKYHNTSFFRVVPIYKKGKVLFEKVKKLGLEGIVCKAKNSLYQVGRRSYDWVKVKNIQRDVFYVANYLFKDNYIILDLAEKKKSFCFVGKVAVLKSKVKRKIIPYQTRCYVKYLERTSTSHLRQPVFERFV